MLDSAWTDHVLDFDLKMMCCVYVLCDLQIDGFFSESELHVFYLFSGGGTSPAPFQNS